MSGESLLHIRLVERLEEHVRGRHSHPRGLLMLLDHDRYGRDRPHRCNGHCPDLFASDLPASFEIIGEAKTAPDLELARSHRQISAFLDHLALCKGGWFYLCVPPYSVARGRHLLGQLRRPHHARLATEVISLV